MFSVIFCGEDVKIAIEFRNILTKEGTPDKPKPVNMKLKEMIIKEINKHKIASRREN